jgi:hypothetical protein
MLNYLVYRKATYISNYTTVNVSGISLNRDNVMKNAVFWDVMPCSS